MRDRVKGGNLGSAIEIHDAVYPSPNLAKAKHTIRLDTQKLLTKFAD